MEKKYPIGGYAPGNYTCKCGTCNEHFQGDKRAVQCYGCASKSLSIERQIIYRIVEQWGNAMCSIKEMEGWLKENAAATRKKEKSSESHGSSYHPLFDLMHQEHGLTLLESQMVDIIEVVREMDGSNKLTSQQISQRRAAIEWYRNPAAPSNTDLEEEANAIYQKYCTDKGIVYHLVDAVNFCLGYMAAKEHAVKFDSHWLIGRSRERFKELEHKGWDWTSFYGGWIEGRADAIEDLIKRTQ